MRSRARRPSGRETSSRRRGRGRRARTRTRVAALRRKAQKKREGLACLSRSLEEEIIRAWPDRSQHPERVQQHLPRFSFGGRERNRLVEPFEPRRPGFEAHHRAKEILLRFDCQPHQELELRLHGYREDQWIARISQPEAVRDRTISSAVATS